MDATSPITRSKYLADGYLVVKDLIDRAELEAINGEINDLFAHQLRAKGLPFVAGNTREAFRANTTALLAADVTAYINTARITQMLPSVNRLLVNDAIMNMVRGLGVEFPVISTRVSIHIMSDELKIPGGYHKTPPHQDWRSIQGSLDNIVLWLPTTPVTARSHALEVVPKSHLLGLLGTADHIMTQMVDDPRITDESFQPIPVDPGDCIAFSSFLVHRTGEEGDGMVRIALSIRFNNAAERTYIQHGYPTPYSYSYRKDLMFEGFPTQADLKTVYPDADSGR